MSYIALVLPPQSYFAAQPSQNLSIRDGFLDDDQKDL